MIAEKIVKYKVRGIFLSRAKGRIASRLMKDFNDTYEGNTIGDGCFVAFDGA